jgi:NAD(P)-dependent dehydrogenase (short-subunit alcohol dehydrogenase family)
MTATKLALVTGAAGGIAAPTLTRLAAAGWRMHLVDLDPAHTAAAAATVPGATWTASALDTPEACAAALPPGDEPIHGVVHLAGIFVKHELGPESRPVHDATMAANATNAFDLMGAVEGRLAPGASVVFVSSLAYTAGAADHPAYSMAKGALIGLTRALSRRWGPKGIRVNALAPGVITTTMPAQVIAERGEAAKARTPLGRFGSPEEVAGPILFLLSDDAGYITGQTIAVDGGVANL